VKDEVMKMYERLKAVREQKKYTIQDMAKIIDKSPCNYFKKENGEVKFTVSEAIKIAKVLKKRVEDIFFEEELSESVS
jgi:DNA-binding XRE family transcriptional regulator